MNSKINFNFICCCNEETSKPKNKQIVENKNISPVKSESKVEELSVSSFRSFSSQREDDSAEIRDSVMVHVVKKEETVQSLPSYTEDPN